MSGLLDKIKEKGLAQTMRIAPRRAYLETRLFRRRLQRIQALKALNYRVTFPNEGGKVISVPAISTADITRGDGVLIDQVYDFSRRPFKETLLRRTIYDLFGQGYLDPTKSIIDIGCWLSDNALVWASLLKDGGTVHAIDPSAKNLAFGQRLAGLNGVTNINWVEAVCAEKSGMVLDFEGTLDHTAFNETEAQSATSLISRTLDDVVMDSDAQSISLIHVDVEGFEAKVLQGAKDIIARDKPVILFEQHISADDATSLVTWLKGHGYAVYMINEVLPGCEHDCRNLIAFDASRQMPKELAVDLMTGRETGIWFATLGGALVPIE